MTAQKAYSLLHNSRFYILVFSFLLSLATFAWLRLTISSDQLLAIRTEQTYGLICLVFWYVALIISPIGHIVGKQRMKHIEFTRRAIGVSAFYFAFLHASISLFGQLGGVQNIQYLPDIFKWSLLGGTFALVILFLMAITSFDKIIRIMTFRKWKWLHRLIYIASVVIIIHIWMIGTHLAYTWAQLSALGAIAILSGLEITRLVRQYNTKLRFSRSEVVAIALFLWVSVLTLTAALPTLVKNYHSRHSEHNHLEHR